MPLQSSGSISISQIRTELLRRNTNSYSLRTLSSSAGKSTPDAMSEFYSFNGCFPSGTFYGQICSGIALYNLYYDGTCNADGTSFGLYNMLANPCSPACGAPTNCPAQGTVLDSYCNCYLCRALGVCDLYNIYPSGLSYKLADGCCGFYYDFQQASSSSCYGPSGQCCYLYQENCSSYT